jgi:hypothetical protein
MKKIFLKILCFALFLYGGIASANAFTGSGAGTDSSPYEITTATQLDEVRNGLTAYYKLMNDINLTEWITENSSTNGWNPISTFTGNFNGNFKVISGLWINRSTTDNVGLFGSASGEIKNLGVKLADAGITGAQCTGAIVGIYSGDLTIAHCFATGNVSGASRTGGILGGRSTAANYSTSISNCYFVGNITGSADPSGGIVGGFYSANEGNHTIDKCYFAGTITNTRSDGTVAVGGITGNFTYNSGVTGPTVVISNCFSLASTIRNTYASDPARILSWARGGATYTNNHAFSGMALYKSGSTAVSVTASTTTNQGGNKTLAEIKNSATYSNVGWNFDDDWTIGNINYQLPVLKGFESLLQPTQALDYLITLEGEGTSGNPYLIHNATELNLVRNNTSAYYQLAGNIDLTDWIASNYPNDGWLPIASFVGNFNGNGHFITGLKINRTTNNVGLFGSVTGNAEISNLGVVTAENETVTGGENVGILAGGINSTGVTLTVKNCAAIGNVKATSKNVGALLGFNNNGNITLENSYAVGSVVSAGDGAGGLIGNSWSGSGAVSCNVVIQKCYAVNSVSSTGAAGGLLGGASASSSNSKGAQAIVLNISDSYAANSAINTTTTSCGRIYGYLANASATVTLNNFAFAGTSVNGAVAAEGAADNRNGLDKTAKELTKAETFTAWDFNTIWTLGNNSADGATYYPLPVLKALPADEQAVSYPEHLKYGVSVATSATGNGTVSSPADIQSGDDVTISLTVPGNNWDLVNAFTVNETDKTAEIKASSGAYHIENITNDYELGAVFDTYTVAAGGTNTAVNYLNGDVVFYSDDTNPAGQLTGITAEGLQVNGAVKLIKTFTEKQWYPVGFPFEIASVVDEADGTELEAYNGDEGETVYTGAGDGDYWLKYYDGTDNVFRYPGSDAAISAPAGYIIQFPDYYGEDTPICVIFSSTSNPVLKNTNALPQTLAATADNHGYYLVASPSVAKVASLNDVDYYYKYGNNYFELLSDAEDIDLNPFEAIVAVKKRDETTPLRASLWIEDDDTPTGLRKPDAVHANDAVIETKYYNLQGIETVQPAAGKVYIVKKIYASGKTEVAKLLYKDNHL